MLWKAVYIYTLHSSVHDSQLIKTPFKPFQIKKTLIDQYVQTNFIDVYIFSAFSLPSHWSKKKEKSKSSNDTMSNTSSSAHNWPLKLLIQNIPRSFISIHCHPFPFFLEVIRYEELISINKKKVLRVKVWVECYGKRMCVGNDEKGNWLRLCSKFNLGSQNDWKKWRMSEQIKKSNKKKKKVQEGKTHLIS